MKISQRQAIYYKKRCSDLEGILFRQRNRWASDWVPGWINIASLSFSESAFAKITTARLLGHAVVVVPGDDNTVKFYADRLNP